MQRSPILAGTWYPGTKNLIETFIEEALPSLPKTTKSKSIGVMVPHAGWMYSAKVALSVYSQIHIPKTVVLIGPNHTGRGYLVSLSDADSWRTPLGEAAIDKQLSRYITQCCGGTITLDESAHVKEHCLEIQLPFLQYFEKDIKIVPLILGNQSLEICTLVGQGIASAIKEYGQEVLILASSDMSHYESKKIAEQKDTMAIKEIIALNPKKLLLTTQEYSISMCGVAPTAVMLFAAKDLGAQKAELTMYDTSGTVTGDTTEVVGYAGVIVT